MNITDVKIKLWNSKGKIKGFADIVIGNDFKITGLKIIDGSKGLFVGMPSKKDPKNDTYNDIAYPLTKEAKKELNDAVIEAFKKAGNSETDDLFGD